MQSNLRRWISKAYPKGAPGILSLNKNIKKQQKKKL